MTYLIDPYRFNAPQVAGAAMSADGAATAETVGGVLTTIGAAMSSDGVSMVEAVMVNGFDTAHFSSSGAADAQFDGAQTATATMSADGLAAPQFSMTSVTPAAISADGVAAQQLTGAALVSAPLDSQGAATPQLVGFAAVPVFSMNGAATVSWVGEEVQGVFAVDAADFDGTNDYMLRGAGLTGAADSKSGTLSVWLRLDGADSSEIFVFGGDTSGSVRLYLARLSDNTFQVVGRDAPGTDILVLTTTSTHIAGATWLHILASWDLAAGVGHLYVNDVDRKAGGATLTNDTIEYTYDQFEISGLIAGLDKFNGAMAELWLMPGTYIDLSVTANRRKFISASGKPVNLGSDGSTPTGTAALVYLHLDDTEAVSNFAQNRGTGGNFTITGTLDTASSSPSD